MSPDILTIAVESVAAALKQHHLDNTNADLVSSAWVHVYGTGKAAAKNGTTPQWFTTVALEVRFLPAQGSWWPLAQPVAEVVS